MTPTIEKTATKRTKCQVSQQVCPQADGTTALQLTFDCDSDQPRPCWWEKLPQLLTRMGFELERDFDDSIEIFTPSSFFSGSVRISASKTCANKTSFPFDLDDDIAGLFASLASKQDIWSGLPGFTSLERKSA